jgi:hypothetical protein
MLTACRGQQTSVQKTRKAELLAQLSSNDALARSEALDQLRADPVALRDPNVQTALVSLLDRENNVTLTGDDEGYAEYVSWLAETVAKIVDWNDSRQVCILANSLALPHELADHAEVAVPCLLQRLRASPVQLRGSIVEMLVRAVAKGKNGLDVVTLQKVKQAIQSALRDPDDSVRADTVVALGKFGGEDMVSALEEVSKTDPSVDEAKHNYWIREYAAKAIAAIHERVGQH